MKLNLIDGDCYYNHALIYQDKWNKVEAIKHFEKAANLYQQQGNQALYQNSLNQIKNLKNN
ncbi:hypothetical protein [Dapis sp. BLCC M229]|uniref:hypothetical protein n=1 Tax=Dapis sp. BLCC M229 TaxID=3400188 RepID=UPI003CEBF4B8